MRPAALLLATCALTMGTADLAAQEVAGVLREAGTDRIIPFGDVSVVDARGAVVASTVSDAAGNFLIHVPRGGEYRLHSVRLGYYSAVSTPFEVPDEGRVTVTIRLALNPVAVDSLHVVVGRPATLLESEGFYGRRKSALGTFLDRFDLEALRGGRTLTDVVRYVPGVSVRIDQFGKEHVLLRGLRRGQCRPTLFLDGLRIQPPWEDLIDVDNLEGLEVYARPTEVPGRFGGMFTCGVIVAWSKPPIRR